MNLKKGLLLVAVLSFIALFFILNLQALFTLEAFQERRDDILSYAATHFWQSRIVYFVLYILVAAFSLPAAAILTIAGGAVFGFWWGLLLVSFASTIGATLAFLMARTLLRDWVQEKFGDYLRPVNEGMEKDGNFYLFTLRLIPVFPFFMVNVLMALTVISARSFYLVSQLGMLFGTALYVNVGAELGMATTLPDVLSVGVIRAIVVLAVFPWLAKACIRFLKNRKTMAAWKKYRPGNFDTNMVVIGGGSAGLVTAYIAALAKARVTLVEKHRMGGDCLNTGCIPSKALIRSAGVRHLFDRASEFGITVSDIKVDFPAVMERIRHVISTIEPHDSVERYTGLGVDCVKGQATITSPWTVDVDGREIRTRNIVLATGARPFIPSIEGIDTVNFLTSDTIWTLEALPERLLVMGGGPIGCELAQAFSRLGARVTLVDRLERIMPREDREISAYVKERFRQEGIEVLTSLEVKRFEKTGTGGRAIAKSRSGEGDTETCLEFDRVLVAVGRQANTEDMGLDSLGLVLNSNGTVKVNEFLQTNIPTLFACGDVAGPYQFTHMASFQAWFASVNSLFGNFKKFRIHYKAVPWATFTDPEVARVGLNESEAAEKGVAYEVTRYGLDDFDRAITDSDAHGFIKVLTVPGKDRILGATIVGPHAAELINEFILAITHNMGLKKIMAAIHIYPTWSESNKFVAGQWRKNNAPDWISPWLEKFHAWRRR